MKGLPVGRSVSIDGAQKRGSPALRRREELGLSGAASHRRQREIRKPPESVVGGERKKASMKKMKKERLKRKARPASFT